MAWSARAITIAHLATVNSQPSRLEIGSTITRVVRTTAAILQTEVSLSTQAQQQRRLRRLSRASFARTRAGVNRQDPPQSSRSSGKAPEYSAMRRTRRIRIFPFPSSHNAERISRYPGAKELMAPAPSTITEPMLPILESRREQNRSLQIVLVMRSARVRACVAAELRTVPANS